MSGCNGYSRLAFDIELQDEFGSDIDMHAAGTAEVDHDGHVVNIGVRKWDKTTRRFSDTDLSWHDRGPIYELIADNLHRQLPDEIAACISDDGETPIKRLLHEYI